MSEYKAYTGVGSRETPVDVLELMRKIATILSGENYILRSGGADGADLAFESGVVMGTDLVRRKEIYLPWKGFNDRIGICDTPREAYNMAAKIHPAWFACSRGARALHARNICQVLSYSLKTPSKFLICWTKEGKDTGGTRTAIVCARNNSVPVWNLANLRERIAIEMILGSGNMGQLLTGPENYKEEIDYAWYARNPP